MNCLDIAYQEQKRMEAAHPLNEDEEPVIFVSDVIFVVVQIREEENSITIDNSSSRNQVKASQKGGLYNEEAEENQADIINFLFSAMIWSVPDLCQEEQLTTKGYTYSSKPLSFDQVNDQADEEYKTSHNDAPVWEVV